LALCNCAKNIIRYQILREYGLHLSDFKKIEEAVEEGAIAALKR